MWSNVKTVIILYYIKISKTSFVRCAKSIQNRWTYRVYLFRTWWYPSTSYHLLFSKLTRHIKSWTRIGRLRDEMKCESKQVLVERVVHIHVIIVRMILQCILPIDRLLLVAIWSWLTFAIELNNLIFHLLANLSHQSNPFRWYF